MKDQRAPSIYSTLAVDGSEPAADQASKPRKAFMALCAGLLLLSAPLLWSGAAQADSDAPSAVLAKDDDARAADDDDGGDDDNSGSGGNSNDDDSGAGGNTGDSHDNTKGENSRNDNTTGNTGDERDDKTGRETKGENTDRGGMNTGVSTRGETDGNDGTGQTERR